MMLTKDELLKLVQPYAFISDLETYILESSDLESYAREVIEANNKKALAELKPVAMVDISSHLGIAAAKPALQYYRANQVSALIQRNEALEAWLEADATCPCCGESVKCLDGCTFVADAPHDYEKMQEVRNVLKATS